MHQEKREKILKIGKETKNMNRSTLIASLLIVAATLILMGTTYAYFTAMVTSEEQVVQSGVLELIYTTGQDIQAMNIIPTEEENASVHQFTVENTGTLDAHYNISFIDIALTKMGMDTYSNNLKWALYQADEDYTEGTLVKSGSFSSSSGYLSGDNEFVIKTNMILAPAEKQSYILKVWLQEMGKPQNEDQGLSLAMTMQVDTLEKQEPTSKLSVMRERNDPMSSETFYQYSGSISKVVFQNRMEPIETDLSWDVSENNDGNCMAYLVENEEGSFIPPELPPDMGEMQFPETTYTLYIQGNDVIYLSSGLALFYLINPDTGLNVLTVVEGLEYVDTSQVMTMEGMFYNCDFLTNLDLSGFDTSHVRNMIGMFYNCVFLTNLDLSSFDTSQVTDMSNMFYDCRSLTALNLSSFDTSQVTNMSNMFFDCSSLTALNLSSFDTSQVTDMGFMFCYCNSLINLNISSFNTSKVTKMNYMFSGCMDLMSLDVGGFDTSKVTNMMDMFSGCMSLTSLDVSYFNTSKVTRIDGMFSNCSSLTELDLSSFDTSQVTRMTSMFEGCSSLTELDLSSFDTSQVTWMWQMFNNCSSLVKLDLRNAIFTSVNDYNTMFGNVPSTIQVIVKDSTAQAWIQERLDEEGNAGTVIIA